MQTVWTLCDMVAGRLVRWRVAQWRRLVFTLIEPVLGESWLTVLIVHKKEDRPMGAKKSERNGALTFAQKLLAKQKEAEGSSYVAHDDELAARYPHLSELLTVKLVDDKRVIDPASVTVYCRTGEFHACLKHKGLDLAWWGQGPTLNAALEALEATVAKEEGQEASRST